jgi:alanine dehydrogenase
MTKIGILRETKSPPDKRVPLSPKQCAEVKHLFPNVEVVVQPSPIRKFKDEEYTDAGITLQEDLSDCDILMGVKEVKMDTFIPNKTYLFFSHTFKMQPYNAGLLKSLLDNKIRLIDYEVIKNQQGIRLIGFGRYAGIVGCYNGFRAFGLKHDLFSLKPAHECEDREEMEGQMKHITLPKTTRIALTGHGRVGKGALEVIKKLNIRQVTPEEYLANEYNEPVYTHIDSEHHNERSSDGGFDKAEFYKDASNYRSTFIRYARKSDLYIACHYWADDAPFIFTRDDVKDSEWQISVVADISCDIDGPVASTIRPSTVDDPIYGYNRFTEQEVDYKDKDAICVMAVDNLPCELPKDASVDFGAELIKHVLPHLLGDDSEGIIANASETTLDGTLTEQFAYLKEYAEGVDS